MTTSTRHASALFALIALVTAIAVELISASGPLLDKPFNEGIVTVALVALGTYVAPGLLVALLLGVHTATSRRSVRAGAGAGTGHLVFVAVLLLGIARLIMQGLGGDARYVTGLVSAALAVAVLLLVTAFTVGRSPTLAALGLTTGALAAAALNLSLGTWDAVWRPGLLGWGPTTAVVAASILCAWVVRASSWASSGPTASRRLWVLGPYLAMMIMVAANPAYLASQLGIPLQLVGVGLMLAVVLSTILAFSTIPGEETTGGLSRPVLLRAALLVGAFTLILFPLTAPGDPAPVGLTLVGLLMIGLVPALMTGTLINAWRPTARKRSGLSLHASDGGWALQATELGSVTTPRDLWRLARTGTAVGLGIILPLLVYQIDYDVPLGVPNAFVPLAAMVLIAVAGLRRAQLAPKPAALRPHRGIMGILVGVGALSLVGVALNGVPTALTPSGDATTIAGTTGTDGATGPGGTSGADEITLLNWNLHFGVTAEPGVDLDAMARVINESGASIVTLQEVSRGWVMGGRADMATYLARAAGMQMVLAPAADRQFNNAILFAPGLGDPVTVVRTALPYGDGPQWRSAITTTLHPHPDATTLTVTSTHLQHRDSNTPTRLEQLDVLTSADLAHGPAILAGDFNAVPGSPEIAWLTDAGYISAQDEVGDPAPRTWPSWDPEVRIDWVWGSEVQFTGFEILPETTSDHRALLATFRLTPLEP